jgi:hypothetical protein
LLRLAADENFNFDIVWGVQRRNSEVDIVRVEDAGLVATMTRYAYERVRAGNSMPGVFEVSRNVPVGLAIDEILLIAEHSLEGEWEGQVRYLPLR